MVFIVKNKLNYYRLFGDIWGLSYTSRKFTYCFLLKNIFMKSIWEKFSIQKILFFEFFFSFIFRNKFFKDLVFSENFFYKDLLDNSKKIFRENFFEFFNTLYLKSKRGFYIFLFRLYVLICRNRKKYLKIKFFKNLCNVYPYKFLYKNNVKKFLKEIKLNFKGKKKKLWQNLNIFFSKKRLKNLKIRFFRRQSDLGYNSFNDKMNLFFYNFSKKIIKENSKFIFRIDFKAPLNLKKKMNFRVKSLKSLRLFYINIKYKQFQKLGKKIIRMDGTFEHNYLYFLECRLVNLVYRSGFLFNMFDCINFVNQGHIFVNKKSKIFQNDIVSIMEFVGFRPLIKGTIYWNFYINLIKKKLVYPPLNYFWVSYKFLIFFLLRYPELDDFVNVVPVDFFRASGFLYKKNIR